MSKRKKRSNAHAKRTQGRSKQKPARWRRKLTAIRRWAGWYWAALIVALVGGSVLAFALLSIGFRALFGLFLQDYSFSWGAGAFYTVTTMIGLRYAARLGWPELTTTGPLKGPFIRARRIFLCVVAVVMLNAMVVFAVLPWAIHQVIAVRGHTVATVIEKQFRGGHRQCSPRLRIKELDGAWFCPTRRFYETVRRGEQFLLEGRISPFGMSVSHYLWMSTERGTGRLIRQHERIPVWQ